VNGFGPVFPEIADPVTAGRSPDDGIFDNQNPFPLHQRLHGIQLHPHREILHRRIVSKWLEQKHVIKIQEKL